MIKLCFSTLGCPDASLKEILAMASDLGYDGVELRGIQKELNITNLADFSSENIDETLGQFKSKNINIAILTSGANLADLGDENITEAIDYINLADKTGAKKVRVLCDKAPEFERNIDIEFVADRLHQICTYAANLCVDILIETNGYFAKSENILALIKNVNMPNLKIIWDIHHPYTYYKEKVSYTYNLLKDYIAHIHIKDSKIIDGAVKYKMLGYGDLPVKEVVNLLKIGGYDGYISLEWVKRWAKDLDDPDIVFPQFIYAMKRLLK